MFKKLLLFALILIMGIGISTFSYKVITNTETQTLDYSEKLENLTWHKFKDIESIEREDTYTYTELVEYLTSSELTQDEITNLIGSAPEDTNSAEVRYSLLYMPNYTYSKKYILEPRVSAALEYTKGQSTPNRILSLSGPHIFTGNGSACTFAGTIFYALTAGNSFYISFNGDLYKECEVNVTGNESINIGSNGTVSVEYNTGDDYIRNVSRSETYYSAGLQL